MFPEEQNPWEMLPKGESGRPQITVAKPPPQEWDRDFVSGSFDQREQNPWNNPPQVPSMAMGRLGEVPVNPGDTPFTGFGRQEDKSYGRVHDAVTAVERGIRRFLGPGFNEAATKFATVGTMIAPGSGELEAMKDTVEAKQSFEEGKYKDAAKHGISGGFNSTFGSMPGAALASKMTAAVMGIPFRRTGTPRPATKTPEEAIDWLRTNLGVDPKRDYGYSNKNDYIDLANYYQVQSHQRGLSPRQVREEDIFGLSSKLDNPEVRYPEPVVQAPKEPVSHLHERVTSQNEFEKEASLIQNLLSPGGATRRQEIKRFYDDLEARGVSERDIPELLSSNILGTTPERIGSTLYIAALTHPRLADEIMRMLPGNLKGRVDSVIGQYGEATGRHPFIEWKESKVNPPDKVDDFFKPVESDPEWEPLSGDVAWLDDLLGGSGAAPKEHVPPPRMEVSPEQQRQGELWHSYYTQAGLPRERFSRDSVPLMEKYILPHYNNNPKEFLDHYFAGMFNPQGIDSSISGGRGETLYARASLMNPATQLPMRGSIERQISPETGKVYHAYFSLPSESQSSGIAKTILRNQVELYQKIGLNHVNLTANIDVGGYAWAKYGFAPSSQGSWNIIQSRVNGFVNDEFRNGRMSKLIADDLKRIASSKDPKAIWNIADYPVKSPYLLNNDKPASWGQVMLMNSNWSGTLNLKDADSLRRFNEYIAKKK